MRLLIKDGLYLSFRENFGVCHLGAASTYEIKATTLSMLLYEDMVVPHLETKFDQEMRENAFTLSKYFLQATFSYF